MGFVTPSMWDDERFVQLSDHSKIIWIYLLTGPESIGCPGLVRAGVATVADAVRKETDVVRAALHELKTARLVDLDFERRVIRVPNAPKYNPPNNPNILIGSWWKRWMQVPNESPLKAAHVPSIRAVVDRLITAAQRENEIRKAKNWRAAWESSFGTIPTVHVSGQRALFDSLSEPSSTHKQLANSSRSSGGEAHSGSALEEVATEGATERDQVPKLFPQQLGEQRDPDLDLDPDLDPDPDPDLPGESASAQIVPLRARAKRFWDAQERLRAGLPRQKPIMATDDVLERVEACLAATKATDREVEIVLQEYSTVSMAFFNGKSNWLPDNFARALDIALARKKQQRKSTSNSFKPTGKENYVGGKVV